MHSFTTLKLKSVYYVHNYCNTPIRVNLENVHLNVILIKHPEGGG